MRIAIISPFYPFRGGIANFADAMAEALEADNEVLRISFCRQYPKALFPGKTQYVDQPKKELVKAKFLLDSVNPWTQRRTANRINEFQPDVVISAYWMPFIANSVKGVMKKLQGNPLKLALIHNYISHEAKFYDKWIVSRYIQAHNGVIALSDLVQQQVKAAEKKMPVVHLPHPTYAHFGERMDRHLSAKQLGLDASKRILLFFGLIRDYKGLDVLLEAGKHMDDSFQIVIAGECYGSFEKYQSIINQYANPSKVVVHQRFIPDEEVAMFFSAADVCVLPYRSATQSGVTAIANFFKVPVIATQVGGLNEFVNHGVDGLLVAPENPKALQLGIEDLFEKEMLDEMKNELNNRPVNTWENFASRTADFVQELKA